MSEAALEAERTRKLDVYEQEGRKLQVFLDKQRQETISRKEEYTKSINDMKALGVERREQEAQERENERRRIFDADYQACQDLAPVQPLVQLVHTLIGNTLIIFVNSPFSLVFFLQTTLLLWRKTFITRKTNWREWLRLWQSNQEHSTIKFTLKYGYIPSFFY